MNQTEEQSNIISLAKTSDSNIMINALAGSGKTTTLEMIEREVDTRPILYLCFNKKNAEEAEERMLSTTTVRTFNSLGHRVWAKACAKSQLRLDPKKSHTILQEIIEASPKDIRNTIWEVYWEVINGVAFAKALGYVPDGVYTNARRLISQGNFHSSLEESPDDLVSDLIDAVLTRSIKLSYDGLIDYNDQIYMPALFGCTFPRFPLVKVDEYQDLNPTNHAMLDKLCKNRLIGVGDPWQNIYAFRGAKQGGMGEAKEKFKMTECDLSTSFRCPKAIVEHVQWRVPHFKWIKEGGEVELAKSLIPTDFVDNAVIICRNSAPLFKVAFNLLSSGRSVSVAGSDIGPKLLAIMARPGDENLSRSSTLSAIADWQAEREAKNSTTAKDMAECMRVFANVGNTLGQAINYAKHLFEQRGSIRLLTGHKSKGLEWDTVYHLDGWLLGEDEQDLNLRYVISTRSKNRLVEINSRDIQW